MSQPAASLPTGRQAWKDPSRWLLAGGVVALSVYVALRAVYVAFTHDESYTFFHYILKPLDETLNVTYTNNHLLNSLLARFCFNLFGDSELSLRLPNVFGAVLFFAFGARLLLRLPVRTPAGKWFPLVGLVAIAFNTYMMDFFGLCRGYGLSLGLLMVSLYFQYRSFEENRSTRYEWLCILFAGLACTANYTLLNLLLVQVFVNIVLVAYKIKQLRGERASFRLAIGSLTGLVILSAGILRFMIGMMLNLNKLGNFNFGGDSLWIDSVGALAGFSCYPIDAFWAWAENIYAYGGAAILSLGILMCIIVIRRREWTPASRFMVFLVMAIVACGLAIIIQHEFLKVPFPKDRTVLYMVPLFSLLALSLTRIEGKTKRVCSAIAAVFFLPAVISQAYNFNLYYTIHWPTNSGMDEISARITEEAHSLGDLQRPVLVVVPFEENPSFDYYLYRANEKRIQSMNFYESSWISVADVAVEISGSDSIRSNAPYILRSEVRGKNIFIRNPVPQVQQGRELGFWDFESNKTDQRQSAPGYNSLYADRLSQEQLYSRGIEDTLDSTYAHGSIYIATFQLQCEEVPVHVFAVMSVIRNGEAIVWKPIDLVNFTRETGTWEEVALLFHSDMLLKPGDAVGFYFLNLNKPAVALDNFRVAVLPPKM